MNFEKEITRFLAVYQKNETPIVKYRRFKLEAIRDYYLIYGYPERLTMWNLSLLTAYFQEAIYDGIKWYEQHADLRHLQIELELDCMFQNNGKMRHELSYTEFEEYIDYTSKAMNGRDPKAKTKRNIFSWLKSKF